MTTQREIAEKLGVTPQFISRWKLGESGLSVRMGLRWSKILDVDFKVIMTAKSRKKREKILGLKPKGGYG